ncbi:MAG: type III pantothenate kinase [Nitrospirae bacterium]|nr:type III pantothenate kinase [Nitrospirota bacterium]
MRLIAIDIGNSLINIGFIKEKNLSVFNIDTLPIRTPEEYEIIFRGFLKKLEEKTAIGVIISSVIPGHAIILGEILKDIVEVEPLFVTHKINTGLKFNIQNPEELGSDRIANAVAAHELYKCPVAALDFGTASTISVVGRDATFMGGAILPGIRLMNESLARGTAQLSEVSIAPPLSALGKDTKSCIQSGLFYGTAGAVEGILNEIEKEIGYDLKLVSTGGYGGLIVKYFKRDVELVPHLTLEGLKILYMRNKDA